jgi:hypothetical protein
MAALAVPPWSASKPYAVAKQKLDEARRAVGFNKE